MPEGIGKWVALVAAIVFALMSLSMYNGLAKRDVLVTQGWTDLLSAYQERADVIPNLVNTVERFAKQESSVLTEVARLRSSAGQPQLPVNATPEQLQQFAQSQSQLSAGLGRLLAVAESTPSLASAANFLLLQRELKTIETKIDARRRKYIASVAAYNTNVVTAPNSIIAKVFGFTQKPQLKFDDEKSIQKSPRAFEGSKG